ncbi:MAG TPA: serine/threonine-protein kinase [Polyangiaceae bacterium]|nr:serine/threonine-protein kinase [Polyangiaceae bacterium]
MLQRDATTTGAFRVKALLLMLTERGTPDLANRFADRIGGRGLVENETRLLTRELWLRAVRDFAKLCPDFQAAELAPYLVHPDTLGAWSRPLRGSADPGAVVARLNDANDGLPGDVQWMTEAVGPQSYRCRAYVGDVSAAEREIVSQVLAAELAAIPLLFGAPLGEVVDRGDDGDVRLFTLTWRTPGPRMIALAGAVAAIYLTATAVARLLGWAWSHLDGTGWWLLWFGPALLIFGLGVMLRREAERMAETDQQRTRIRALEREALLNRKRSMEISRPHEEPVIAGQYRVGRQLGVGANGAVWEATRLTDGVQVALKLLRSAVVHDVRATDRLRREAEALGLAWHPNVVEVLDTGVLSSGVGFLVMELLHGETLAERLHTQQRLTPELTRRFALQAADALFAVHSAGVIHRDIKPGNLFLARDATGEETLKLIDFGVARISWAETRLTRSGVRIGTLGYASPEQEQGQEVDGRTDIYGLGVSLRECLTGDAPEAAQPLPPLTSADVPPEWKTILERMTAIDPADRYASARELRDALVAATPATVSQAPAPPAPPGADVA